MFKVFMPWRKENKMPDVVPFLTYENGIAALDWLAEVFWIYRDSSFQVFRREAISRRNVDWGWTNHVGQPVAGL